MTPNGVIAVPLPVESPYYLADVLGGIAVGAMGFSAGTWLMQRRGALPETEASSDD